ncbi:MAG: signal recognition particle-docking protein FtsY, partial [Candidatus Fermentibacteraceae bacterium]|nr:signal recognition particle-docking protein FtsY [Candidatus Fermentibacteraceae bacterium]
GSDAGAVVFDAIKKGLNRNYDAVLIDTAGRLPNKKGLLDELSKIYKVAGKAMDTAPHRVLLVLDGTVGQNALSQARQFMGAMPVTGLVITKLDGTARGGAVLSMASILGIPVEYIGVGEGEADLVAFNMESFVHALLDMDGDGP